MRLLLVLLGACSCLATNNFTLVGPGRCTKSNSGVQWPTYITGAYNAVDLRTMCEAACDKQDQCVSYWYYTGALLSSCYLDGRSAEGTNAMVAALGGSWSAISLTNTTYCNSDCTAAGTDKNKFGGHAECYGKNSR